MFVDSHNHVLDYLEKRFGKDEFEIDEVAGLYPLGMEVSFCASSNEEKRFAKQKMLCSLLPPNIHPYYSFGIHPQKPSLDEISFLEKALKNAEIAAIGECGFDLFTKEYASTLHAQKEAWGAQVELAIKYEVPLIIHCRRAIHLIFADAKVLKKVKAVVFHGWGQSAREASSLLKRGVNAYFCIGKALLRGQKSQKEMAACFDASRLLTETDAPYMSLKNQDFTSPCDIEYVVGAIANLRSLPIESINSSIFNNFNQIFF